MPVLQIQWFEPPGHIAIGDVLAAVNQNVAAALGCDPASVWSTWTTIEPGCYAEGDDAADGPRDATHPPIVRLLAFEGREGAAIESALIAAAHTLAAQLGIDPDAPFVVYDEIASGWVFTGGSVRRKPG
ncbi:MAG: hypothetical protein AAFS11_01525 [Planctomycetota bacterium]